MIIGKTFGAPFLLVEMMSQGRDLLVTWLGDRAGRSRKLIIGVTIH